MNENLPQKYRNNIFLRFLNRLKSIFISKKKIDIENPIINDLEIKEETKSKFVFAEEIKVETNGKNEEYERKQFIENLTNNPNLLQEFSNERLEKILQYYLDENEKKNIKKTYILEIFCTSISVIIGAIALM